MLKQQRKRVGPFCISFAVYDCIANYHESLDAEKRLQYNMRHLKEKKKMAQISFRMDDDLKMSAEDTFKSMGMTMSTAITIFVTQTVRDGQFPFVIKSDPFYSPSNMSVLRRRANDMDARRNVVEHDLIPDGELVHA